MTPMLHAYWFQITFPLIGQIIKHLQDMNPDTKFNIKYNKGNSNENIISTQQFRLLNNSTLAI